MQQLCCKFNIQTKTFMSNWRVKNTRIVSVVVVFKTLSILLLTSCYQSRGYTHTYMFSFENAFSVIYTFCPHYSSIIAHLQWRCHFTTRLHCSPNVSKLSLLGSVDADTHSCLLIETYQSSPPTKWPFSKRIFFASAFIHLYKPR